MNYIRLWKQAENSLILNKSIDLMGMLKQANDIMLVRVRIKSWDELANLYGIDGYDDEYIRIREDNAYFTHHMKKFCGEEFEIAIQSNKINLFYIVYAGDNWPITRHMVDIIDSNGYEINKSYPIIRIPAKDTIILMWEQLYGGCNKSERKILNELIEIDSKLAIKIVKVKSWNQLKTEYITDTFGDIKLEKDSNVFTTGMRPLCGQKFTATYQDDSYIIGWLRTEDRSWAITMGMVTEI